ncbi:MAG: hypothetical protein B6I28_04930 [Fusobacteriia bacterium 4572_132]|nr:MAG: hypothetical protein B6I28_04930 [Fusobacteriia bacterium 4572_132]
MKRNDFFNKYNIHSSYFDFFTQERINTISKFINKLKKSGNFAPKEHSIFRALENDLQNSKVLILGKDPYFQPGAATGIAFEVNGLNNWQSPFKQRSLQNIIRVIYQTYTDKKYIFSNIRKEIDSSYFEILPPNKLFQSWHNQDVILLNSFLTVKIENGKNTSGSHEKQWNNFTKELLTYISTKNPNINYFLWGAHSNSFAKNIINGNIYSSNHPSMAFGKSKKDFLFFNGFKETKNIVNWTGISKKRE